MTGPPTRTESSEEAVFLGISGSKSAKMMPARAGYREMARVRDKNRDLTATVSSLDNRRLLLSGSAVEMLILCRFSNKKAPFRGTRLSRQYTSTDGEPSQNSGEIGDRKSTRLNS